ncbi:hypothetical protein GT360_07225 [Vibrio astriarenae]|uniref:Uncharacterized protein n=1 Tax=Vibrio astriarenae TaxID=1481923 RepID=A0A7Z2YDE9_9VIBR|nr:hypothetical protein [Vibrio astriarenae]QIA63316.1 hypothetical protein GT360_07200 [Vibrio astriarenae]QIA63321.1 hypothetical protein GT360_07225 [Vibrio astriarenae]
MSKRKYTCYSPEDTQYLIDNYGVLSLKQIALDLNRTYYSVVDKRKELGLRPNRNFFTEQEDDFILANVLVLSLREVAEQLGRSKGAISMRAKRLGVSYFKVADDSFFTKFPQEDINMIRDLRDLGLTYSELSSKFGISPDYIGMICRFDARLYESTEQYHEALARQRDSIQGRN